MRRTEGAPGGRYRRAGKAAGAALLGLLCGSVGCQGSGDRSAGIARLDPPLAALAPEQPQPLQDRPAPSVVRSAAPGMGTAAADAGLAQATFRTPDGPSQQDRALAGQQGALVEYHGSSAEPTPTPVDAPAERQGDRWNDRAGKDPAYRVDLRLPSPANGIDTPVIPAPEKSLPITLAASLALAGVENPVIALADQAIRVSQGQQLQARALLLPGVNVGASYDYHDGPLQASFGGIRKGNRQAVNYGFGTNTVAAETQKIPGLWVNAAIANAIYEPLVARQVVANRRFRAAATRNHVLLEVATSYLALLGSEGRLAVLRQSEADFEEVARLTRNYAKSGQGRKGDADRAAADLQALRYQEQQAQEDVAVAAAELAHYLNLDPSTRLHTGDVPIQVVQFIDPYTPLPKLLDVAAQNRPEMMAAAAAIRASQVRVTQEKTRPLLPLLVMGFSGDMFGGGSTASSNGNVPNPHTGNVTGSPSPETGGQTVPKFGRINGRTDFDVLAVWTLQNAGFGNLAHIKERRAELGRAEAERARVLNEVAREVSEAYNTSAAQFRSIELERRRVQEASDGFQRDLNRIRGGIGFPIEVLNQAKRLASGRQQLLEAVIAFDRAQFELFVALGQPPTLVVDGDKSLPPPAVAAGPPPLPR